MLDEFIFSFSRCFESFTNVGMSFGHRCCSVRNLPLRFKLCDAHFVPEPRYSCTHAGASYVSLIKELEKVKTPCPRTWPFVCLVKSWPFSMRHDHWLHGVQSCWHTTPLTACTVNNFLENSGKFPENIHGRVRIPVIYGHIRKTLVTWSQLRMVLEKSLMKTQSEGHVTRFTDTPLWEQRRWRDWSKVSVGR